MDGIFSKMPIILLVVGTDMHKKHTKYIEFYKNTVE